METRYFPLELTFSELTEPRLKELLKVPIDLPVFISHKSIVPLSLPIIINFPSGVIASELITNSCLSKVFICSPLLISNNFIVLSALTDIIVFPSGVTATDFIEQLRVSNR